MRKFHLMNEEDVLNSWSSLSMIDIKTRLAIQERAIKLVNDIRDDDNPALLELFLAEYGLSTDEGVALMCLAEALMRSHLSRVRHDTGADVIRCEAVVCCCKHCLTFAF